MLLTRLDCNMAISHDQPRLGLALRTVNRSLANVRCRARRDRNPTVFLRRKRRFVTVRYCCRVVVRCAENPYDSFFYSNRTTVAEPGLRQGF